MVGATTMLEDPVSSAGVELHAESPNVAAAANAATVVTFIMVLFFMISPWYELCELCALVITLALDQWFKLSSSRVFPECFLSKKYGTL
jgi:hypothetical protein